MHGTLSSKCLHWTIEIVLIPILGFQKNCIVISSLLVPWTVHAKPSSKYLHWRIQVVLIAIAGFCKNWIVISCPDFCHELCMEHSLTHIFSSLIQVLLMISAKLPKASHGYTLITALHSTQLISSLHGTLPYKLSNRVCVSLAFRSGSVERGELSCADLTEMSYYCLWTTLYL